MLRCALIAGLFAFAGIAPAQETRNVLALYSSVRTLPANVEGERGLRDAIGDTADRHVEFYTEFLDVPRFGGAPYVDTVATYLRNKYAAQPPDVIFVGGDDALAFALTNRNLLFPRAPIVHASVPAAFLRSLGPLPADVVGDPVEFDSLRTIDLAFRLHPNATQLILVTGSSDFDRQWEARLRGEVPQFPSRANPQFFAGLSAEVLEMKLATLGDDAIVFTPGYFADGDGRSSTPRDAVKKIVAAARAPVYGPYGTFIDTGIVGGYMPSYYDMGHRAGEFIGALLDGADPTSLPPTQTMPTALNIDWRQVERWGIEPESIPTDAVVQFREPSLLEAYRTEVMVAVVVILLQSALIAGLLFQRRRRREAETSVEAQRLELAHASRLAIAGELTASIAHEINQPLGAILSNADAGELILESGGDRRDEMRAILKDIRRDDRRASEVIRRLRELLDNHEYERTPFQFNDVLRDLNSILSAEAKRRVVTLDIRPSGADAMVVGDRIQIQQVLINLVLNAMDAMSDIEGERRVVVVARNEPGRVAVEVRDNGPGIAAEDLPMLFESFFTTKRKGMGLGLSIASRLISTHGGRIWAENGSAGGAVFHFELPTLEQPGVAIAEVV